MRQKLSDDAVLDQLKSLPSWCLKDGKLHRSLKFKNFVEAFAFMTAGALEAEKMNHHPEWCNCYAGVEIDLETHDAKGITDLDFRLAAKFEGLALAFLERP